MTEASKRGRSNRARGAAAERELMALLSEHLGITIRRELRQTRDGGADSDGLPGWAVECKHVKALARPTWWRQACAAAGADRHPLLMYRQPRPRGAPLHESWIAVVPTELLPNPVGHISSDPRPGSVTSFLTAISIIKGTL